MFKRFETKGFTLIELLVVIVIIGILAAIALPNYIKVKDKAKEAEVKANLHNIQLSVERFAVDTEGVYPSYLIGGEPKFATNVNPAASANAFTNIVECDPIEGVSDPLLRRGYIDAYPRNPFTRNGIAIHQVQEQGPSPSSPDDPMRNIGQAGPGDNQTGGGDVYQLGTRFGPYCTTMGSVLADLRFETWVFVNVDTGGYQDRPTNATIVYEFWDMWEGNRPLPYLPGQFFYKGCGPIIAIGTENTDAFDEDGIPMPTEIDQYMLGGYGSIRTKGKDMIGDERQITYTRRADAGNNWLANATEVTSVSGPVPTQGGPGGGPGGPPGTGARTQEIWPWTRSSGRESPETGEPWGSPYQPANPGESNDQLAYGNPNGVRDGIILVLTAGEDYIGDR